MQITVLLLDVLLVVAVLPIVAAAIYYALLAAIGLCYPLSGKKTISSDAGLKNRPSFVIIVPAHNEEQHIAKTIQSLQAIDYPPDKFSIVVVADNCSDQTAAIARQADARCLERHNLELRGKDWALDWAFKQLLPESHDFILIVDADCLVDPWILSCLADNAENGGGVFQTNNVADNPDDSSISYLAAVANRLENNYYCHPQSILGQSVFLRGTGMCFHTEILRTIEWRPGSEVEDLDYSLRLLKNRTPILFLGGAAVYSNFPVGLHELTVQRTRWLRGGGTSSRISLFSMMATALSNRDLCLLVASWNLFAQRRVQLFIWTLIVTFLATIHWFLLGSNLGFGVMLTGIAVIFLSVMYLMLGMVTVGFSQHRLRLAFNGIGVAIWWLWIGMSAKLFPRSGQVLWERTPRAAKKTD